ncbi:hypothetical protein GR7B_00215 [Vibrio phage vB_VcorM_GR7B]|nr:hypothetical protein GR7B_00215 [Vibrio phage vB_VcorM_GR7B]
MTTQLTMNIKAEFTGGKSRARVWRGVHLDASYSVTEVAEGTKVHYNVIDKGELVTEDCKHMLVRAMGDHYEVSGDVTGSFKSLSSLRDEWNEVAGE